MKTKIQDQDMSYLLYQNTESTYHQIDVDKYLQRIAVAEEKLCVQLRFPQITEAATSRRFCCSTSWLKL